MPVDSLFSPVTKVSYRVENTREGQILDYDKLIMEVETDGSINPDDAVALAARILQDQLAIFVNFEEPKKETVEEVQPENRDCRPAPIQARGMCRRIATARTMHRLVWCRSTVIMRDRRYSRVCHHINP